MYIYLYIYIHICIHTHTHTPGKSRKLSGEMILIYNDTSVCPGNDSSNSWRSSSAIYIHNSWRSISAIYIMIHIHNQNKYTITRMYVFILIVYMKNDSSNSWRSSSEIYIMKHTHNQNNYTIIRTPQKIRALPGEVVRFLYVNNNNTYVHTPICIYTHAYVQSGRALYMSSRVYTLIYICAPQKRFERFLEKRFCFIQ